MKKLRLAINGFGRIGRIFYRALLNTNYSSIIDVVAVNDLAPSHTLAHLLKYDSNYGALAADVVTTDDHLVVGNHNIKVFSERDPYNLPWDDIEVDIVIEATGIFNDLTGAFKHLDAGAKKVILSSPPKGEGIPMVVWGVTDLSKVHNARIISNASCTTNCLAPMVKVLDDNFGIESGYMNTIHAYTSDQNLHDAPHKDLRRARGVMNSIIPTSTGAAKAIGEIMPHLAGKIDGIATRVPVSVGSVVDFTAVLSASTSKDEINNLMNEASKGSMASILKYTEDPIVSVDIIGNKFSCIFDSSFTVCNGKFAKVLGWYDNEYGYSSRLVDLTHYFAHNNVER